jgi:fatty-acyl-CoA synthase
MLGEEFARRFRQVPARVQSLATLMARDGLWRRTSPRGMVVLARTLAKQAMNPTLIYKIHAANSPNHPALIWRGTALRYAEVDAHMDALAGWLNANGIAKGDRAMLFMRNRPEYIIVQGAITRAGCGSVNASWRSTAAELGYLLANSKAKAVFFEASLRSTIDEVRASCPWVQHWVCLDGAEGDYDSYESIQAQGGGYVIEKGSDEDAAVFIYTSGTTGKPKGAVRKFPRDAVFGALQFVAETPMSCNDVHLVTCPLYHATAFGFSAFTQLLGGSVVIMDEFKPEAFLQLVEQHRVTTTAIVPTMLHRILALGGDVLKRYDTSSLRAIFSGGAPLPGPLGQAVMDHFGDVLFNFYGATEVGLVTLAKPEDLRREPTTIGRIVPGNEVKLLDDEGREVPQGQVGELFVRNATLVEGYHNDAAGTQASMRDGFFSVGDLARRDSEGRYFIEGRKRDMVISGGVNVYPAEVEGVLERHPEIEEVAVVGIPDPEWGERVRAFVVARENSPVTADDLKAWCRTELAGPKVPRDFVFLQALPRNPTGKVLKRELRDLKAQ